jgi:hypothetical protein
VCSASLPSLTPQLLMILLKCCQLTGSICKQSMTPVMHDMVNKFQTVCCNLWSVQL